MNYKFDFIDHYYKLFEKITHKTHKLIIFISHNKNIYATGIVPTLTSVAPWGTNLTCITPPHAPAFAHAGDCGGAPASM